jgi:ABC-2 type transport system permease protein
MISLGRAIFAEWIKLKATSVKWIFLLIPLICALLFLSYFGVVHEKDQVKLFRFYMDAICIALPFLISLICGMISMQEERAGHYQVLLGAISRSRSYIGKLMSLILLTSGSIIGGVVIFMLGATYILGVEGIPYLTYIQASIVLVFSCIVLYLIYLFIAFVLGLSASVTFGGAGLLLTALMGTGLGDGVWKYIPWGWGIRFMDSFIVLKSSVYTQDILTLIKKELVDGMQYMTLFTVLLFSVSLWWFNVWEGRQSSD